MAKRTKRGALEKAGWFDGSFNSKSADEKKVAKSVYRNQQKTDRRNSLLRQGKIKKI